MYKWYFTQLHSATKHDLQLRPLVQKPLTYYCKASFMPSTMFPLLQKVTNQIDSGMKQCIVMATPYAKEGKDIQQSSYTQCRVYLVISQ